MRAGHTDDESSWVEPACVLGPAEVDQRTLFIRKTTPRSNISKTKAQLVELCSVNLNFILYVHRVFMRTLSVLVLYYSAFF